MGYLLPGHDGLEVPPDGQSSLETAVAVAVPAAAVAVPSPAPRRRRHHAAPPSRRPPTPGKEFLQFNMDLEVQ